ncbi:hypothetical protein EV186_102422 [Labedaea rhizosphaerae]|uniref:Uncharacterized protein n=1 Tax=Labedaea rhizosphaerae TaxID=598644 RepID=A0A4V3CZP8_LABRH|nr:hypothetical protein EV186_102422 [Labedaea rhizosphaerae]
MTSDEWVLMIRLRFSVFVASLAAVPVAIGLAAPAAASPHTQYTFVAYAEGYGATSSAAQSAAVRELNGDYFGCGPWVLVYDNQLANGTWDAEVAANCQGYR